MASMVDQPVGIDTTTNKREPILGVTFDNLWSEGEPYPTEYIILVPDDFDLVKCDRGTPTIEHENIPGYDKTVPGYDVYIFNKDQMGDVRQGFQSLTCRLHIKDDKLSSFLAGSQKVTKTFVAMAKYNYVLKKSVRFDVKE
jgi:hypothetical protein